MAECPELVFDLQVASTPSDLIFRVLNRDLVLPLLVEAMKDPFRCFFGAGRL
jgi:hypothetical protein